MLSQTLVAGSSKGFLSSLQRLTFASPIYNFTLFGRVPDRLLGTPPELMPGTASAGQAILAGSLVYDGRRYPLSSFKGLPNNPPSDWLAYLHGFAWLADLRSVGSPQARHRAQALVADWLNLFDGWDFFSWRPDIAGARLANWITHFAFFAADADARFLEELFGSLARQSRHLSRTAQQTDNGLRNLNALKGLIYVGIAVPESDHMLAQGLDLMESAVEKQVLSDGGHHSRSPETQLEVLKTLLEVQEALTAAHVDVPNWLKTSLERMVPMTRALRMGDGSLAHFNGGMGGRSDDIDVLLSKSGVKAKALQTAPHSGFHRLAAGKTCLVLDAGKPPTDSANDWPHAGSLAFEMSVGKERLIVNCGSARKMGEAWQNALRTTAAHSTLVVDDVNSSELNPKGGLGRKPHTIHCSRREIEGRSVLEANHDGYKSAFDLVHRRILMLAPDGTELVGEDQLTGTGGNRFAVRFHLHPNVQATLIQHGNAVLLKPRRGRGWKLAPLDHEVLLEESVYIEEASRHRRTQKIVIPGKIYGRGATVKWQLVQI